MSTIPSTYRTKPYGFTIVELLIVIVVIAILAAVSIVAYNGVQARASNTATISSVVAYAKAVQLYAVQNGAYPDGSANPCLGGASMRCANVTDFTQVTGCNSFGGTTGSAAFDTALKTVATTLPAPSTKSANCGGKQFGGAFYTTNGSYAYFYYWLLGNVSCSTPGGATPFMVQTIDAITMCGIQLSAPN